MLKFPLRLYVCVFIILGSGILSGLTMLSVPKIVWQGQATVLYASPTNNTSSTNLKMKSLDGTKMFEVDDVNVVVDYINNRPGAYNCTINDLGNANCVVPVRKK